MDACICASRAITVCNVLLPTRMPGVTLHVDKDIATYIYNTQLRRHMQVITGAFYLMVHWDLCLKGIRNVYKDIY